MRTRAVFSALGLNAVPAAGWFFAEWSAGTTLLVYWIETLLSAFFITGRILLHRRAVPSKGHWDYKAPAGHQPGPRQVGRRSTFLEAFLPMLLMFTIAHGVFLGALGWMAVVKNLTPEAHLEARGVLTGVLIILFFQSFDFCMDLIWVEVRPFRWIECMAEQCIGRIFVVHLTIIGGMCAVAFTGIDRNFFGVFIFLKTLLNLGTVLPQYNPQTPPAWLCYLMDRVPSAEKRDNTTFAEFWQKNHDDEAKRIARNEKPIERSGK